MDGNGLERVSCARSGINGTVDFEGFASLSTDFRKSFHRASWCVVNISASAMLTLLGLALSFLLGGSRKR